MSLADKKRKIFSKVGAFKSQMDEGKDARQTDLFTSINNKDDIIPYLLDVLKVVAGTEALKETIGGLFSNVVDDVEPELKTGLKKQFVLSNASDPLPAAPYNFVGDGITVPVKEIDPNGMLKTDPSSEEGNLIYGSTTNFNTKCYDAISNSGTEVSYSNMSIKYIEASDSFQIKPSGSTGSNIGEFFTNFIDSVQLINKKIIIAAVMAVIYGTLTKKQNKTVEQTYEELQIQEMLQQVLDDDDSFVILPEKLDGLLSKSQEMVSGELNYDMGCGLMATELQFDDFNNFVQNISGSTDPFYIGNQFENTINQSVSGDTTTQDMTDENKQTIKDGFFQKIIGVFNVKLLEAVTITPQIRTLFGMMSALQNNGTVMLDKPTNDMGNFKTCIKCMSKEIMKIVAAFIFGLAIAYLVRLITPLIKDVVKEQINQYSEQVTSLNPILDKFLDKLSS